MATKTEIAQVFAEMEKQRDGLGAPARETD